MTSKILRNFIIIVLFACVSVSGAASDNSKVVPAVAASYQNILPANTLALFSFADTTELKALLEGPEVVAILTEIGMKDMLDSQISKAATQIESKTGFNLNELYNALKGDITFALIDLQMDGGNPNLAVLVGMDGGSDKVLSVLNEIKASAEAEEEVVEMKSVNGSDVFVIAESAFAFAKDSHLVITSKFDVAESILNEGPRLVDNQNFTVHQKMTGLNSGFVVYANIKPFTSMVKGIVQSNQKEDDPGTEAALKLFDMLALDKIESMSMSFPYYYDGKFKFFVYAPGYDGITTKIFSSQPVDKSVAAFIPHDNDVISICSIQEPVLIYDTFVEVIKEMAPPEEIEKFDAGMEMIRQKLNLDIRDEFLAGLGTSVVSTVHLDLEADIDFNNPVKFFKSLGIEVLLSVKNTEMLKEAFDKIIVAGEGNVTHESAEGAEIYNVWAKNPVFPVTVALSGKYLRLGLFDSESMKANLNTIKTDKTMDANAEFNRRTSEVSNANILSYTSPSYIQKWIDFYFRIMNSLKESETSTAHQNVTYDRSLLWFSKSIENGYYVEGDFYPKDFINLFKSVFVSAMSHFEPQEMN